ncbi:MAG: RHS repeat-associated core domain-containing protein [Thermofilaceae archaeon]
MESALLAATGQTGFHLPAPTTSGRHGGWTQLRSAGTWTFTYTPNGERASETNNPVAGYQGNWNYAYDIWGNLTHAYWNGQLVYEAQYDAFGNRVWAKVGNQQRYYLYEGDTLVAELDASGNLMAEYVWGLLGPIARVGRASGFPVPTARVQLYVLDGLGHVRVLLGRTQSGWQITDSYAYDSWGNLIGCTGNTNQPFTWNGAYGYEYNPATGLYHVGAREYDPRTARWLQRDPIDAASGDPNLYRYAGNDPINQVDPDGTDWSYHDLLDAVGFIPGLGEAADALNAIGYALEGDYVNAAISAAGMLPGGDVLKAGRLAKKVVQEVVEEGAEQVAKREAKNALQEQGKKHANKTSGNNPYAQKGKEVHKRFKEEAKQKGWDPEKVMTGKGGQKVRPDAYDPKTDRCKDLKPNTKRGRQRGKEKQKKYKDVLGKETDIIYYDPDTGTIYW